ncbi:MAG: hypothetical protein VKP62_02895 [Candidatus Sericytochromatia bacterium]|nr:hypothetical protein [Candidatus Sericytochromatia bacterium]
MSPLSARRIAPLVLQPSPRPDWDHARTPRALLRTPDAEWGAALLFEQQPDGFWAPSHLREEDGLSWRLKDETWRFLERLALQLTRGGEPLPLNLTSVELSPEQVEYVFAVDATARLVMSVSLVELAEERTSVLRYRFTWEGDDQAVSLSLKPWLDIRRCGQAPDPARHRVNPVDAQHLTVVNTNHWLAFRLSREAEFLPAREQRDVRYPLGEGHRLTTDQHVHFKPTQTRAFAPGVWRTSLGEPLDLFVQAGLAEAALLGALETAQAVCSTALTRQQARYEDWMTRWSHLDERVARHLYVAAEKFWIRTETGEVPDADASPARRCLTRLALDGLRQNWKTLEAAGKWPQVLHTLDGWLSYQDPRSGRFPIRWPGGETARQWFAKTGSLPADYYEASDLGLPLFTWVGEAWEQLAASDRLEPLWEAYQRMFQGFKLSRLTRRHGGPVLLENGMLLLLPHHGWMDAKRTVFTDKLTVTDLPARCPLAWHLQDVAQFKDSHYTWEQYQYPTFYLPEANALWLRTLEVGIRLASWAGKSDWVDELQQIEASLREHFKGILWNQRAANLYNAVTLDRRIDGTPTVAAIEAAALLGEPFFSRLELEQIWQTARNRLLLTDGDTGTAVGLLARDTAERLFQDGSQLHDAVWHPRALPAVLRLLRHLGQEATRRDMVEALLTHGHDEGALFYVQEAFVPAEGPNPTAASSGALRPVPVRSTRVWWSQCADVLWENAAEG